LNQRSTLNTDEQVADKIKIAVAVALLVAGIAAFYYWSESLTIIRVLAVIGGAVAGGVVFLTTAPGKVFFAFSQESIDETKRVVWPTRKETLQTTGVVFAFVAVMAVFLWVVDAGLLWAVRLLMGRSD
jgi:preprotein translocase subunit SecE